MALNNGLLTSPIKISEVKTCLGATNVNSLKSLCTHANINMWAKYKPVENASCTGGITEDQRKYSGYGITATKYTILSNSDYAKILDASLAGNIGWIYTKPSTYYRLMDFNGYNHNAEFPFYFEDATITGALRVRVGQVAGLPTNNMSVTDISGIIGQASASNSGYGFIIRNGNTIRCIGPKSSDDKSILYPLTSDHEVTLTEIAGTWEVCCFIWNESHGAALHPVKGYSVVVKKPEAIVKLTAELTASGNKTNFTAIITGNSSTGVSAGTAALRLFNDQGKESDIFTYEVPFLAMGETSNISEKLEVGYSDIASWSFTYAGVTITG